MKQQKPDVEDAVRIYTQRPSGKDYFNFTTGSVQQSASNSGRIETRDDHSKRNLACWLASKAIDPDPENPMTWERIADQCKKIAGTDSGLWVSSFAEAIRKAAKSKLGLV